MNALIGLSTALILSYCSTLLANTPAPALPNYARCAMKNAPEGSIDSSCQKRVDQEYQSALQSYAMANNLAMGDNGTLIKPSEPALANCSSAGANQNYACMNKNLNISRDHNDKIAAYDAIMKQRDQANQNNTEARSRGSSADLLVTAETKATEGKNKQNAISKAAMVASIGFGLAFTYTCATAKCQPPLAYASAAALVVSIATAKQAKNNEKSALDSCEAYNRISSVKKNCGEQPAPPTDPNQIVTSATAPFPYGQVDSTSGKCLPSAPASCQTNLSDANNRGLNIKDVLKKGPSAFAGANAPYKLNPDGSVTMKDGKTFKPEDFASKESMMAAGMSAADAKAVANDLYGKDGIYAKAGLDAKADLAAMPKGLGSFDMGPTGASNGKGTGDDREKLGLGAKEAGGSASRKPTASDSEGLVRDFNGDSIGISNDNIFTMMNKRYILKSAQDSFIGQ